MRGRNFFMPKDIRPTSDKIRKAAFDILGGDLGGLAFLDLFAGSGSVGFEAISRGAKSVTFVEKDAFCLRVMRENLEMLRPLEIFREAAAEIFPQDAFFALNKFHERREKFDIIFVDPPYRVELAKKTLKTLGGCDILRPGCLVIVQHDKREILPSSDGRILRIKEKTYGDSWLTIYQSNPTNE